MNYKEFLKKAVSVTTSVATVLVLSGVAALVSPGVALAANEGTSEDVTGDDPRIAADGESERVFLGLNLLREDNTDTIELDALQVTLDGLDSSANSGDDAEAAAATIETVRLYKDSTLSGTNGVFDSADALVKEVSRSASSVATLSNDEDAGTTTVELSGTTDLSDGDKVRIGTGATAEIREVTSTASSPVTLTTGLTYAHSSGEQVSKVSNSRVSANTEGFQAFDSSGSTTKVELGDFDNSSTTSDLGESIPKSDSGDDAGNDFFVVLVTKDGTSDMEIKAQVFTGDVQYVNEDQNNNITATIGSATGTTNGKTKTVTYGADGVAPSIESVTAKDSDGEGRVDQLVVVFSESMSTNVSSTEHFTTALGASTGSRVEAGSTDMTLESNSEWSTTSNTNDTLTIDVTNDNGYTNHELSTGDSFTVVYDQSNGSFSSANRLTDTTGEELGDESVSTTDGAAPSVDPGTGSGITGNDSATLHDLDGDGQIDELRVRTSESLDTSNTTHAGWTLKNTTDNPDTTYTISGVNGFVTDDGSNSNSNDTVKLAVTESGSSDVDDTFTLKYTKQNSGGILDSAGNSAPSDTSVSLAKGTTPVITKAETVDDGSFGNATDNNGQIDRITLTFTCDVTQSGSTTEDWTVSGYTVTSTSDGSGKTFHLNLIESGVDDTDATPDVTYTDDGETSTDDINCGDTNFNLEAVSAGDVTEEDSAPPQLQSVKLYEDNADDIWNKDETLQLVFSEDVDASTVATSWNTSGADGSVWTDWLLEDSGGSTRADAFVPDSGTISVSGKVVTLTASEGASSALTSNDQLSVVSNEVKDAAANSAEPTGSGNGVSVTVTPSSAPSVSKIQTKDLDGNGTLDAFHVFFDGLVDASTLTTSDWEAARGSNFSVDTSEEATATSQVDPDLTVTSVETLSGGNDSVVVVHYDEANEGTGDHPQVKYVKGSLTDLAGNEVSTFNAASDTSKFETTITNDSDDGAAPKVMHKRLKDRDDNGKYDQLLVVFSEGIDDDSTSGDALANGTHSATGWSVSDHTLSSDGNLADNDGTYDAYTFETTNVVFKVDILENGAPDEVPDVTYSSTGNFKDEHHNNVLGDVSAGDEVSDIAVVDVSRIADGDLISVDGDEDIYIAKRVGSKMFKRLILNPDIFNSYGHLEWGNVKSVTQNELDQFETSNLIKEDGAEPVWQVSSSPSADTGQKQHLNMSASDFESCGYDWDAIYTVNSTEASDDFYPQGVDITDC